MFLVPTLLRRVLDMPPRDDGKLLLPGLDMLFDRLDTACGRTRCTDAQCRSLVSQFLRLHGWRRGDRTFWHDPLEVSDSSVCPFRRKISRAITILRCRPERSDISATSTGTATGYHNDAEASDGVLQRLVLSRRLGGATTRIPIPRRPREGLIIAAA